ncbi:zinc finger, GRF-type [Artemisia annua]|uniref:Zinc finger, GRF-type n=1 Tax=Artemisia annua TaxID=35608 RepID=A0A2U1KLF4_ARTAN|nr:zinc finger, GRF-type [Artemisia annua]PWA99943.1 zinc finger, GRF-type [Artemisia annua]
MVNCNCQPPRQAVIRTSWTQRNPGRRFYCCSQIVTDCGYFDWLDPPMCARSVQIIPGLLASRNVLEESLRTMAAANGRLKMCLVLSWVFFIFFLM